MEKNEQIRKYEMVVILDDKLSQEDKDGICKNVANVIQKEDGKVINSQVWLEKQKFSLPIKKCSEGTYYIINFDAQGAAIEKIKSNLKLNERILRFIITSIEFVKTAEAAQV